MDSKTSSDTTPTKKEVSETIGLGLLANCAKNGDEANSKLAKKTLKDIYKILLLEHNTNIIDQVCNQYILILKKYIFLISCSTCIGNGDNSSSRLIKPIIFHKNIFIS